MDVLLTSEEMRGAAAHGCERHILALEKKRKGAHGFNREDEAWQIDIEGVCAELAAANALGLDYNPVVGQLDTHLGDIGAGLQVRSTKYKTGHLLVHDTDPPDDVFILVTGLAPIYSVVGWAVAKDFTKPAYWRTYRGRGAYWIPQEKLRPMEELQT